MTLKNLFDMVKADRYTADGREALIKAQKAETEDKVYQIGEISQKTGLQKTANGWVKPKKGAAGAKTGEGKSPSAGSINRTPERIKKETAIMEALNLSTGEDNNLHKMSDETIERLYKKAMSDTPAPKKENPTRTFTFNAGPDGKPVPGTGKQVQTFKTKEEAQKALNTQNAAAKYKNLPGPQRKDALFASTFEGISIGQTQNQMERQGWDLIKADDQVNVYGKPDGSKVTMKHDGKNITETNYEAPAAGSESKTAEKPALSQTDGKGNKVEIKITESKGGGFYVDKYVNGKKVGINNANTRESAEAKAKSMMEQHMADPDYKAESKPAAGKTSRDPMEEMRTTDKPMGTMQKQLDAGEHDDAIINTMGDMDALEDVARDIISPAFDAIGEDIPETYMKFAKRVVEKRYDKLHSDATQPEDAAPRVLTGDTKIRVRK